MVHIPLSNECFRLDLLLLKNSIQEQTKHGKWKLIIMEILFKNPNLSRICWQGISKSKYSNSCSEFPWMLPLYGTKYLRWKHQNSIYSDPDVKLLYIRHQDEWFRVFFAFTDGLCIMYLHFPKRSNLERSKKPAELIKDHMRVI